MKKLIVALALVLGLNMMSSLIQLLTPASFAQEEPKPEPTPPPKPEKPESE